MTFELDTQNIKAFVEKNGTYTYRRRANTYVLPLPTRKPERAKFENGYASIIGATLRVLDHESIDYVESDDSIEEILKEGKFDKEETAEVFRLFIENELRDIENSSISRIEHFKNVPFIDNKDERKGELGYFYFFYDLFIRGFEQEFNVIFKELTSDDLLSEILSITVDQHTKPLDEAKYKMLFPELQQQFIRDVKTMASNPSFLIQNIADLALHYTFVVMTQIVIQTNKLTKAEYNELHRVVFLNISESGSKRRDFINQGLRFLREEIKQFFAHEHTLNILGYNTFSNEKNWFYIDYETFFEDKPTAREQFIQSIYNWINHEYTIYFPATERIVYDNQTLQQAFKDLYDTLRKNVKEEVYSRYSLAYETIVTRFYRKAGGSYGNILALTHNRLITLVAVAVGPRGSQLELNKLWTELERRGVFFDKYSKEEVVKILDNLNYLDKKSDSGDAQYVKAIL